MHKIITQTYCTLSGCRGLLQNKYEAYELKSKKKKEHEDLYSQPEVL